MVGLVTLLQSAGNSERAFVVSAVYGVTLILLFLASSLVHGVHCSPKTASRLEQFDRAAIFLLIAGTYTPVCLLMIKGTLGWGMLAAEWILAVIGVWSVLGGPQRTNTAQVIIYLCMGWLFMVALGPMAENIPASLFPWLIGGALFYSVGSVIFLLNWPPLWKGVLSGHDIWHLLVLGGSACHFVLIEHFVQFAGR